MTGRQWRIDLHWPWRQLPRDAQNLSEAVSESSSPAVGNLIRVEPIARYPYSWAGTDLPEGAELVDDRRHVHYYNGVFVPDAQGDATRCFLATDSIGPTPKGALGAAVLWELSDAGYLLAHCAVLAYQGSAVVVLGSSGAGKSHLCAAWIAAGERIVTDDGALLIPGNGSAPRVEAWRQDASFRATSVCHLPQTLVARLKKQEQRRADRWLLPRHANPGAYADDLRLAAFAVLHTPEPRPTHSSAAPTHSATAYARIYAGNSHLAGRLLPNAKRLNDTARAATAGVPVMRLQVGAHLLADPVKEAVRIRHLIAAQLARH